MPVVYDCSIHEVMGYPERNFCVRCGDELFLIWGDYFDDLMRAMWKVYGYDPDPDDPSAANLEQVPLLRRWNEGGAGARVPFLIIDPVMTARALRDSIAPLHQAGSTSSDAATHGEALVAFLEATRHPVEIEEVWG